MNAITVTDPDNNSINIFNSKYQVPTNLFITACFFFSFFVNADLSPEVGTINFRVGVCKTSPTQGYAL